jgi:hypothetical protein
MNAGCSEPGERKARGDAGFGHRHVPTRAGLMAGLGAAALALALAGGTAALAQSLEAAPGTAASGAPDDPSLAQLEETPDLPLDPGVQELLADSEGVTVPDSLMRLLSTADPRSEAAIADFLSQGNPTPTEVGARAVALSRAVQTDPVLARSNRQLDVVDRIGQAVSSTLCAPRVMTVNLDNDYVPPAGVYAYDFGGWSTPVATGFERLTPASQQVYGTRMNVHEQVGDGAVLSDAIGGLSNLVFDLPNGDYRVILMTTPQVADAAQQPFGASFGVNGVSYHLGTATSDTWWDNANLSGAGAQQAPLVEVAGQGGGIVATATVADGTLQVDFDGGYSGLSAVLSGVLIEPAGMPSSLLMEDQAGARQMALEDCLELELQTQIAMLDPFPIAAGPELLDEAQQQAQLGRAISRGTGLGEPATPFDPEIGVSPFVPSAQ